MMRLVEIEVRRALARRLVRVLIGIAVLGIGISGVLVFVNADPRAPDAAVVRQAEEMRASQVAQCQQLTRGSPSPPDCNAVIPRAEELVDDPRFKLVDLWREGGDDSVFMVTALFLVVGGLIGGASFVGAEWKAGTVATALTWEPRRVRLLGAKLLAAALVAFVVAVLLHALMALALLPAAGFRGTTAGADVDWLGRVVVAVVRISAITAGVAVAGACIASIGRNTAAGIGLCFGYALVAERLVQQLRPGWRPWLLLENAVIGLTGRPLNDPAVTNSLSKAIVVLLGYLGIGVAAALTDFRRRDVA